jgi:superfamily II DNA or RNA helicase
MQQDRINLMNQGFETAFIDYRTESNLAYRPHFISNDYKVGKKVLASIEQELLNCDEFFISVAFITMGGITPLLQTFRELKKRGIKGKIMTTNYLTFSEPKALRTLDELSNIELRMYCVNGDEDGFHTKGYIFREEEFYRIIVGSSNMTLSALTRNKEWNTKIVSTDQGEYAKEIFNEFKELWGKAKLLNEWIDTYTQIYEEQKRITRETRVPSIQQYKLEPNAMQVSFSQNLKKIQDAGEKRALLISATGTGKTYASAFALRSQNPKKALFLVHREQIAKQAIKSYRNVFGDSKNLGLLSGNSKDFEADYLFSTMQMMARDDIRERFKPDEFQTIIVDEAHRSGATSYKNIMNYFTPDFWIGMTASPERTDNFDVYNAFDHNIAYEIRLQQALEENLLCPFHYFGITDLEIDGETFDDTTGLKNFNMLTSDQRVDYVIEQANYFGYCGDRVKGLVFCSSKEEARVLSTKFNLRGFRTTALTGDDNQEKRETAINQLVSDNFSYSLDYIFTVDIFNEGVDIPEVNQVIMLRPTESPIVFIQQLGRGLRKSDNKEYVVILDFIGNYLNNFMIPIALSGDRSYNKDTIRRYVMEGSKVIPGSSSIHFDEVSKKRIFSSIDKVSTTKKLLTEKYLSLKLKLGKIPTILDFYNYGEIDPLLFINYAGSYHKFLNMVEKNYVADFTETESSIIEFISSLLANGKRPHELVILQYLIGTGEFRKNQVQQELLIKYELQDTEKSVDSAFRVLQGNFVNTQSEKKKYEEIQLFNFDASGFYRRMTSFYHRLQLPEFYHQLSQLIELGLKRYMDIYSKTIDRNGLVLYQKYSRKDICRLLNWERDDSSTIYGYKIKNDTCPIFVTYEKKEDIASSTKYEDQFVNNKVFSWMTRSKVSQNSTEAQALINHDQIGLKIYLFVKKSDGEGTDFYYMGQVRPINWREKTIRNDAGKVLPIMNFQLELEYAVQEDIYDYFVN